MSYTISISRSTTNSVVLDDPRPAMSSSVLGMTILASCASQLENTTDTLGLFFFTFGLQLIKVLFYVDGIEPGIPADTRFVHFGYFEGFNLFGHCVTVGRWQSDIRWV